MSDDARQSAQRGGGGLDRWIRAATVQLAGVSDTPRLDAELLAAHSLGLTRQDIILSLPRLDAPTDGDALLARRLAHEPIAYITGTRDFWTLSLRVTPDVLVPRPDSETLIEAALAFFDRPLGEGASAPKRILDLGTGTGALLLAALDEWRNATGLGIDASAAAVVVAQDNAARNEMADRAIIRIGNWADGIDERFDLILCNPPYIEEGATLSPDVRDYEPASALFAGVDGLDDYRVLAEQIGQLIAPGGVAIFEIGFDQGETAAALFRDAGFNVVLRHDLAGQARALVVTAD